jgi:hypothetical protein
MAILGRADNSRGPLGVLSPLIPFCRSHFRHFLADPYRGPLTILADLHDGRITALFKRAHCTRLHRILQFSKRTRF